MKNTIKLILFFVTISIASCEKQGGYVITGNVTGFPDSTMIYLRNLSTDETFDSAMVVEGKFKLTGRLLDEPEEIWLNAKVSNEFIYAYLLIGNENIQLKGNRNDFPWNVRIDGSKTQDDYNRLRDLTKSFDIKRDSLVRSFFKMSAQEQQEKAKDIWDNQIKSLDDTTKALLIQYVKSHVNTYPGIINLDYLKKSLPKDTVQALYNQLNDEIRASKYARIIKIFLSEKIAEVGDYCHDFKALTNNGDTIRFSDLTGKYILLNFTSAYCGPCIQSVEELKMINKNYSDSLEIISLSTDMRKETWLESLERDTITWKYLWDGEGAYSETYIKYGIQGVPTFFLINSEGKIIDKWEGFGKGSLQKKLKRFETK